MFSWHIDEFKKARLKLTAWYIVISFFLLTIFSLAAITAESKAFDRVVQALNNAENRTRRPQLTNSLESRFNEFDARFKNVLYLFDIVLLVVASGASYFLSGRTLLPIQKMIEDQEEFSADVSHELRTPLTAIRMEIEALDKTDQKMPAKYKQVFQSIQEEVTRMKGIVDGLLTLVRPEPYNRHQNWRIVDIHKLTADATKQMEALAAQKRIDYQSDIGEGLRVKGREDQLKQVLIILIDNAIKYAPIEGQVKIKAKEQRNLVQLSVEDNGSGIAEKDLRQIFDRFYRGQKPAEDGEKGLGLGLAIAKKIVESHNGRINVQSQPSQQTTFTVELPAIS